jgi:ParB/RepB/Spo0J family partition protein
MMRIILRGRIPQDRWQHILCCDSQPATERRSFDETKLAELADSLRTQGLIQPITVRPNSDGYEIIAGARRFRAAQLAAFDEVPVRVVQLSDAQALEWMLVELSIVGKSFRCRHAVLHVVYM